MRAKMRQKQSGSSFRIRQMACACGQLKLTLAVAVGLALACAVAAAVPEEGVQQQAPTTQPFQPAHTYEYRCFAEDEMTTGFSLGQSNVGLQVSDRATDQIMTRIFAIFLRDKLKYQNVSLEPYQYNGNMSSPIFEMEKFLYAFNLIRNHPLFPMINLAVWMTPIGHKLVPFTVYEAGSSITPGRYGWFVPASQHTPAANSSLEQLHYSIFLDAEHPEYAQFLIPEKLLNYLRKNTDSQQFISPACLQRACVTLLAEHRYDTVFVEQQIIESNALVNVLWLGAHFRQTILWLHEYYQQNETLRHSSFIVLHWTPSELIDAEIKFRQIVMPRCEELNSLLASNCKYELTPILKYYSKSLSSERNSRILQALRKFSISDDALAQLQSELSRQRELSGNIAGSSLEDIYNAVACNWLKGNAATYSRWISAEPRIELNIGGIFPISETSRGHENLVRAVQRAVKAINDNATVLTNYKLTVIENDGQCKADVVMRTFIHYFNDQHMLGVLGPACSETVEPIAGLSRHMNMAVISYSAEGATFVDRDAYPFFFRTIGTNRQYEDVYISLMQHFGWRRVAALTEDGQKYTEYISHMEATLKHHNLELILNKKFLSDVTASEMEKHLLDLKQRHAKIIIADIHTRNAELALCAAYKLGMTAHQGYVWFLPAWLSKNWNSSGRNGSCNNAELQTAFEGHLSIMHTPYGHPNASMQENISIDHWLKSYRVANESISDYSGFAYDAVWAYALAADKLVRGNVNVIKTLRMENVVKKFTDLVWETDFEGLSGRVRFGQGGSRITQLNIMQWHNASFHQVGSFEPNIVGSKRNLRPEGGQLLLRNTDIKWLWSGMQPPGDGTYDCSFAGLAEFLGTDCDNAAVIFAAIMCFLAVVIVSLVSFLFWKQRYDSKLKKSAKIMKNFGIDLLSPSRSNSNTLDKWEIPKENVVINRRLGEGAFGTVYGGEAQLKSTGWAAVAVKTLKAGASTEDRLDFLSEAEAMKRFDHKNIVQLLGVCLQSEPIYTIMEFMLYGDLKTYLLARRHLVNEKYADDSDIAPKRLTMYAMDVACGLAYLAQQKYVHRDIACRNCLVNAQRVVKLGDFGMARPTFESDYYRFNRKGMLPVRWMAPESLALGMFTPASDVWAFGVVLYEVITFGSFPYQGLTNNQVLEHVKNGNTLDIPIGVKPPLEGLIKACWSKENKKRPTASEIVEYISNYPRLLTACLDFPGASVEMPQSESDELELLPKVRKCSPIMRDATLDILAQTPNSFERCNEFLQNLEMPEYSSIQMPSVAASGAPSKGDNYSMITPDGYSIMSPLLMHQVSESSDSSQARLLQKPCDHEALQQTPF